MFLYEYQLSMNNPTFYFAKHNATKSSMGFYKLKNKVFSINENQFNKIQIKNDRIVLWSEEMLEKEKFLEKCENHLLSELEKSNSKSKNLQSRLDVVRSNNIAEVITDDI